MLVGFVLLGQAAGTYRLSEIVASPPSGTTVTVALVLVLLGAFTKSAQYPFHSWLPGAMVAPTPISAYLHSATMVTAGVYLVARLSPAFATEELWRPTVFTVGLVTMLGGRAPGAAPARPEAPAGLRHRQPARLHVPGHRRRHRRGRDGWLRPAPGPRRVQGRAVHGRRHHRPRDGHARHAARSPASAAGGGRSWPITRGRARRRWPACPWPSASSPRRPTSRCSPATRSAVRGSCSPA